MNAALIANLRAQLGGPRDGALLRFSLANTLFMTGETDDAIAQCRQALDFDPHYSAAWKLLGKTHLAAGHEDDAAEAWRQGIAVARERGDKQAEKEMTVFLRRLMSEE